MSTPPPARDTRTPVAAGALALGAYALLLGVVCYGPFTLSPLAQQNDVFLTNLFLGLGFLILGSVLVAVAASRMAAHPVGLTTGLGILSGGVAFAGVAALLRTGTYGLVAPVLGGYTVLLLALSASAAARYRQAADWARALLLALAGTSLVTLAYVFFGGQYHDVHGVATYLPRYLDGQTSGLALLLGVAVFVLASLWARRAALT